MKQLTLNLLLSLIVITLLQLTSCNSAEENINEIVAPAVLWSSVPYQGRSGDEITMEGINLTTPQVYEIIVNEDLSIVPTSISDTTLSFVVPEVFSSGKLEVLANEESIFSGYFRFLDEQEEVIKSEVHVFAFDFTDDQNGIYLDNNDMLYKTSNGGNSWIEIGQGAYQNIIYAVTDQQFWKQKDHRTLEKTLDGGNSWSEVQILDNMLIDHFYASSERVIVLATIRDEDISRLYTSTDNGESWEVALTSQDFPFKELRHHKVVYQNGTSIALMDITGRSIIKTTDMVQWEKSNFIGSPNNGLKEEGIFFLSQDLIWYSAMGGLAKSTNGGENYINYEFQLTEFTDLVGRVHFFNEEEGVAVASDGGIIRTTDGGESWAFTHIEGAILEADFLNDEKAMILIQDNVPGARRMIKLDF